MSSGIKKLDYPTSPARKPLLHDSVRISSPPPPPATERRSSLRDTFFEHVAEGIEVSDREQIQTEAVRYLSFVWSNISWYAISHIAASMVNTNICQHSLCAGSITTFSLYAPLFLSRLHYTQYQVTTVSIAVQSALYLPVPLFGFLCDRFGPRYPSLFASVTFAASYILAAYTYRNASSASDSEDGTAWPMGVMVVAFIGIGISTSALYLASVSTCAKNFAKSKNKGFALAAPISAFGLSGMWLSQVGSKVLYEKNKDGSRGDIDVFKYFIFLAVLLGVVGVIGFFLLRIVDENQLIDEAVEELERSGLLENNQFFHSQETENSGYGTMAAISPEESRPSTSGELQKSLVLQETRKKTWLLNAETQRFLSDPTMWTMAAAFFLIAGPGDAFINNFGTILGTLYPPPSAINDPSHTPLPQTSPATHITIIAVGSTIARLLSGSLSDLLSPSSEHHEHRRGPASMTNSVQSLEPTPDPASKARFTLSRLPLLLFSTLLLSIGFVVLASGIVQDHASPRFAIVTGLIGVGYGATFSLTPIIISCVWGVENFGYGKTLRFIIAETNNLTARTGALLLWCQHWEELSGV